MRCGDAPHADWLPQPTEVFRMSSLREPYPPFEVTAQRNDGVATVVVSGELDLATVPSLSATVAEHGDARLLVLDLNAVTFIDSTGVRVLIEADRACAGSGSRLVVLAGDGPVRRVLDLCALDGRLAVVTDHPSPAAQRVAVTDTGPMTPPRPKLIPRAG
jgi:anti-sigma B factor antagonist